MSTGLKAGKPLEKPKGDVQAAAHKAADSRLIGFLTRLGYLVRGLVYGMVGASALQVAIQQQGRPADQQGAIAAWRTTPLGDVMLYVILVGLIGYSLWGVIRAVFDPWRKGHDAKGIVERIGFLVSAASYGLLAAATYGLIVGAKNGAGQTERARDAVASILSKPGGVWALGIIGLIVLGFGLVEIVESLRRDFDRKFDPYALSRERRIWFDRIGRVGTAARGVVFTMAGLFVLQAAYYRNPQDAKAIDLVLSDLLHRPYGPWLLGIVASGLIVFGVYSAISGIWLRFKR